MSAFGSAGHEIRIVRRCVDVVELLAVATAGQCRVALIDAGLRRLDADAVDRLLAVDVVPVGVVRRGDAATEDRVRAMGIAHVVPDDADPGRRRFGARRRGPADVRPAGRRRWPACSATRRCPWRSRPVSAAAAAGRTDPHTARSSRSGVRPAPRDAPRSRSTSPTNWPGSLVSTLLVDADVYGGTVAASLGLLDESPGLAAACRQAGNSRAGRRRTRGAQLAVGPAPARADRHTDGPALDRAPPRRGHGSTRGQRARWPTTPSSTADSGSSRTRNCPSTRSRRDATAPPSRSWTPRTSWSSSVRQTRSACSASSAAWLNCATREVATALWVVLEHASAGASCRAIRRPS